MKAYFDLRERLAELYPVPGEWRRVARDAGADVKHVVFDGTAISVWTNILNALRTPKGLEGLTSVLERENPQFVPLARAYAAEVAKGEGAIPDFELPAVDLGDEDLHAHRVLQSLDFVEKLPGTLLDMALADGQPTLEEVDAALNGGHTLAAKKRIAQFRSEAAQELAVLEGRRQAAETESAALKAKIEAIEKVQRPTEPVRPDMSHASDQQRQFWEQQHAEKMNACRAALAAYEADRVSLDGLHTKAAAAQADAAGLGSEIAARRVRKEADERAFEEDVAQARDRDLLLALDQILDRASAHVQARPFNALCTLLAASGILELFERIISEAPSATEASRRFSRHAEASAPRLENALAEIARRSLAGATLAQRALAANRQTLAALDARLAALPSAELRQRHECARRLLQESLPEIPEWRHLEKPTELDDVMRRMSEMQTWTVGHIAALRSEIEGEPAHLRRDVDAAQADAESTLGRMAAVCAENAEVLRRTRLFWSLVARAAGSAQVPPLVRRLCAALPKEVSRRIEAPLEAVIGQAADSNFGIEDARTFVDAHLLTQYLASAKELRDRLAKSEEHLADIAKAIAGAGKRASEVGQDYRTRLTWVAVLSSIPVLGLTAAIWAWRVVDRLQPLVTSDKPAYIRLGNFMVVALAWAAALSGMAAAAGAVIVTRGGFEFTDPSFGIAVVAAAFATLGLSLRNLLKAIAYRRERQQPPPAAAG